MNLNDYQAEATKTANPFLDVAYFAAKLVIEAAEASQPIIKTKYHDAPLDRTAVVGELGDVLWYVAVLADHLNVKLEDVAQANVIKLRHRHGEVYRASHYHAEPEPAD